MLGNSAIDDPPDIIGLADIGNIGEAFKLMHSFLAIACHDVRGLRRQCFGEGSADSTCCSCDYGDLAVQSLGHGSSDV